MAKTYALNMTEGPLFRKLIRFALPLMLSGLLQLLFNCVDTIVVGRYVGETALAAVGSTGALVNLIVGLFMGLSVGTNVLCATGYGAGKSGEVSDVVHTSVAASLVFGAFLAVFGAVFSRRFLLWMGSPDDVIDQASVYLTIYFIGMPVNMLYNFASAALRSIGDTRRPLYYLLAAGVANVVLNLFFVLVLHIDVAGVAIATVISQAVAAFLTVLCLMRETSMVHLDLKKLRIDWPTMGRIAKIGLPAGLQSIVFSISNVLIQSSINSFGSYAIAGNTAACNLENLSGTAMNSFYQTNLNFASQNAGAKRYDRVLKCFGLCAVMVLTLGVILGLSLFKFGPVLLRLYTDNDEVVRYGMIRIRNATLFHAAAGLMDCMVGSLRGLGASILPMIVSLTGACAFRIVWIMTIFAANRTLETLYISYPISWTLTFIAHFICFMIIFSKFRNRS